MDIRHLTYFITIAEEQNMTKAAEKLFVSQSSLSYSLAKLEADIGVPLFFRVKNKMILSPAGQLYLEAARQVVSIKDSLYKSVSELEDTTQISVGTTSLWGTRMMANIVPRFKKLFPGVLFQISQLDLTRLKQAIANKTFDFGLISVPFLESLNHDAVLLQKEELLLAVPANHPFVRQHPSSDPVSHQELIDSFSRDNFLLSPKGTANRELVDALFTQYGFPPPPNLRGVWASPDLRYGIPGNRHILYSGLRMHSGKKHSFLSSVARAASVQYDDSQESAGIRQTGANLLGLCQGLLSALNCSSGEMIDQKSYRIFMIR